MRKSFSLFFTGTKCAAHYKKSLFLFLSFVFIAVSGQQIQNQGSQSLKTNVSGLQKHQHSDKDVLKNKSNREKSKTYEKKLVDQQTSFSANGLAKTKASQATSSVNYDAEIAPTGDQSPLESVKGKREDVSKRDQFSKTYQNKDGSFTALIGAGPIHYKKNGQWLDIDAKIVQNPDTSFPYANSTNLLESYFGTTVSKGIKSKTDEGVVIEFMNPKMYWEVNGQPVQTMTANNSNVNIQNDKATYTNIYGNISAEYQVLTGKRELNYIIPAQQDIAGAPVGAQYLVFSEEVILPVGWTSTMTDKGIQIKDNLGKVVYLYENPVSTDQNISITKDKNTIFETLQIGNTVTILTKVKTEWLLNSERVFPVKVDPTIYAITQAWATGYDAQSGYTCGSGNFIVGFLNNYEIDGFGKFDLTSIPSGSTITAATSSLYHMATSGSGTLNNTRQLSVGFSTEDPITALNCGDVFNGYIFITSSNVVNIGSTSGYKTNTFTADGRTQIQNDRNNKGYTVILPYPSGTFTYSGNYAVFGGYIQNQNAQPYLNITYTAPPSCNPPTNLNVDQIAATSARFTWTAASPAPAQGYDYYYNTTGTPPGSPSGSVAAGVTTRTQTGLTPNRTYHFWIRSKCSASSTSAWVYGGYFNTLPDYSCFQEDGQSRGTVHDGSNFNSYTGYSMADDFIVDPGEQFTVKQVSIEMLCNVKPTTHKFTIQIRSDSIFGPDIIQGGGPIWANAAPSFVSDSYTSAFGYGVYHVVFNIAVANQITLQNGVYWLEVNTYNNSGGAASFWRTTDTGNGGVNYAMQSNDYGNSWYSDTEDTMFWIAGDCVTCPSVTASSTNYSVCEGDQVTLSATTGQNGFTYHWYIGWDNGTQTYDQDLGTGATKTLTVNESTAYWVVATNTNTGCRDYTYVIVAVTPPPSLIVMDPVSSITCSDEVRQISVVSGGVIPPEILNETCDPLANPWITNTVVSGGPGATYAAWFLAPDNYGGIRSPNQSNFVMVDSDDYGPYQMESSLISPPMSFLDYNTPVKLEFNHYFRQFSAASTAYVEITTDGINWTALKTYTTTQGAATNFAAVSINLNTYVGAPFVQIRFRYNANYAYYWALDDIKVTGSPKNTTVRWAVKNSNPVSYSGLYKDVGKTQPYAGENLSTVYASPSATTTYTISAKTAVGCPAEAEVTVEKGDKNWTSTLGTDWNTAINWSDGVVPTAEHCVKIPGTLSFIPTINNGVAAKAKNVTVYNGGSLLIKSGGSLTVTDYIHNESNNENFLVESGGSLVQNNDNAPNSGGMKAEKNFNLSAARKQYNLIMSPVAGQDIRNIFGAGNIPFSLIYNEATDYFVVPSQSAYTEKRGFASKEPVASVSNPKAAFSGGFTNGLVNLPLQKSAGGQGFNLIGNPYPSNLDMKNLYDDPTNAGLINSSFYFWDNRGNILFNQLGPGYSTYNFSNYVIYNAASNMGNPAGTPPGQNLQIPNRNATVGSGFLVQALQPGMLNLKNAHRTLSSGFSYTGKATTETEDDRYWLSMTTPIGLRVMTAITYFEGGNNGFGVDDSEALGGSDEIFTMVGEHHLAIQGKVPFVDTDVVKLGYRAWETGINKIEIFQAEGIFANGQTIYIRDKALNNAVHNLSNSAYYFKTRPGEVTDRFEIIYRRNPLFSSSGSFNQNKIRIDKIDHNIVVTSDSDKITEVEIFSLSGIPVYKNEKVNSNELKIPNKRFGKQLLVVVAKTDKGEIETRMIEVKD